MFGILLSAANVVLAVHSYLHDRRGIEIDRLGSIVHVRTDDISQAGFFPVEVEDATGATVKPGFVQPGDLVVVDEAWKLWDRDQKISKEHMTFFRMHRHFVHDVTGVACDVVLMIQSIGDLHRSVKAVVELSFRMVKLKRLGLSNGYRVEMYETAKQTRNMQTGIFIRKYKPEIFPLYRSYAGGSGQESQVDKRQNVLGRKSLWVLVAAFVALGICGLVWSWRYFHQGGKGKGQAQHAASGPVAASAASGVSTATEANTSRPHTSTVWRVAGSYRVGSERWIVLADAANRFRVESPSEFSGVGVSRVGTVEGERVSMWSGADRASGGAGASPSLMGAGK